MLLRIYVNNIKNRITFKIKTGYLKSKITKDEYGGNMPGLKINEVILVNYNIVNNGYQNNSRVLNTYFPNKSFCQLLDISPKIFMFLKKLSFEFSYI